MSSSWLLAFALIAAWSLLSGNAQKGLAATLLSYVAMNISYCVKLKQIPLLDVFMIAMGFVLRILAGGLVVGIHLSHWIVLTTFLLALFLALSKRYDDVALFEASGVKSRKNISQYNKVFLGPATAVLGSITIMCYILYTVSGEVVERIGSRYLYATSVFVLAGILRYMQLTLVDRKSGSPTMVLLHDHFVHVCIVAWIMAFVIILYA
jgi:4-hydroxybenzoate polyprenyltransferase